MAATTTVTGSDDKAPVIQGPRKGSLLSRLASPYKQSHGVQRFMLVTGSVASALLILLAIFAPHIAPYSYDTFKNAAGVEFPRQGPPSSLNHWGSTVGGLDVMSRALLGARTAVEVVALAVVFSVLIGVPLGLVSGYLGGWLDRILVLVMDALFAFPYLLLAIVAAFLLKDTIDSGIVVTAIAITVVYVPQYFRVVRASTLSAREATYIEAARAMGAKPSTIIRKYLFGNVVQSVPVIATLNAADAILTLAGLGFLGLGIQPDEAAEWGYDLQRAVADAGAGIWWTALYPGLGIVIAVTALTLVGEGLNDVVEPDAPAPEDHKAGHPHDDQLSRSRPGVRARGRGGRRTMSEPALSLRNVRIWYGHERGAVRAVDGVSLDLMPGETVGLVGESGCGKSTLGRGVLGLLPEGAGHAGEVSYKGQNILELKTKELRRLRGPELGMIFQEPMTRLNPLMKISGHFEEVLKIHEPEIGKKEARRRALETLRGMGIPPTRYHQYPHEFSGGMRQRIMIALALVLRPAVVVADEPTTALDVLVEAQILRIIADLRRNFDTALLLITHNLGIVAEACDRVAVMYAGRIVEQGPAYDVTTNPSHPYSRELLASTISLSTQKLHSIPGAPPNLVNPPTACRFHPRCPDAMSVCSELWPPTITTGPARRSECWVHAKEDIPAGLEAPLKREALGVAEEA